MYNFEQGLEFMRRKMRVLLDVMTYDELAALLDVHVNTLRNLLRTDYKPSMRTFLKVQEKLYEI